MLDVHPPHAPAHTWKDFLIHIATIVCGLLIAVGLEQTVEFFHHRHQRSELREALRQDNEKALRDNLDVEREQLALVLWLSARMHEATLALHTGAPVHEIAFVDPYVKAVPSDPNWKAARSSTLVEVLPQQDITAYAEVSDLIDTLRTLFDSTEFTSRRMAFEERFRVPSPGGGLDFSTATRQDLMQEISLLSEEHHNALGAYAFTLYLRGCLTAVLQGERNLDRIDEDEIQVEQEGLKQLHQKIPQDMPTPQAPASRRVPVRQGKHP
jgi:hypothetical protein